MSGHGFSLILSASSLYSLMAKAHMQRYGTTIEQLGRVAAKSRNCVHNPKAQVRRAATIEDILTDRLVSLYACHVHRWGWCRGCFNRLKNGSRTVGDVRKGQPIRASVVAGGQYRDSMKPRLSQWLLAVPMHRLASSLSTYRSRKYTMPHRFGIESLRGTRLLPSR